MRVRLIFVCILLIKLIILIKLLNFESLILYQETKFIH